MQREVRFRYQTDGWYTDVLRTAAMTIILEQSLGKIRQLLSIYQMNCI